ncbi:MAG: aminotransferase class I/II-fold pyridoxal phosphate-dependent enzyme [Myxococcota bacterium]|nr:aminotransferase class I/II-fold pyridoxal phosphate-dependent enzyme [Myxococcota bacterium]
MPNRSPDPLRGSTVVGRGDDRFEPLRARVRTLQRSGLQRQLRPVDMIDETRAVVDGQHVAVFSSNDYLGLARTPAVMEAWAGAAAGSARLIAGDRQAHHRLEAELARRHGMPVTLFSSGWHANLALYTTVLQPGDIVASDALNHASTIDALRLSKADRAILPHGSTDLPGGCRLMAVEGLYSMDGDIPDLRAARAACDRAGAWLAVDEAHAVGALGPEGQGAAALQGVAPDFLVGTLGKAYGAFGAYIAGPPILRELLVSAARTFIYTTGLPEPVAHAALVAVRAADRDRRQRLSDNVARLRTALRLAGIPALGDAHIVPVVLGPRTMDVAASLLRAGFLVPGIRAPTVPPGRERLRITVSSAHKAEQIDGLVEALVAALAQWTGC